MLVSIPIDMKDTPLGPYTNGGAMLAAKRGIPSESRLGKVPSKIFVTLHYIFKDIGKHGHPSGAQD